MQDGNKCGEALQPAAGILGLVDDLTNAEGDEHQSQEGGHRHCDGPAWPPPDCGRTSVPPPLCSARSRKLNTITPISGSSGSVYAASECQSVGTVHRRPGSGKVTRSSPQCSGLAQRPGPRRELMAPVVEPGGRTRP